MNEKSLRGALRLAEKAAREAGRVLMDNWDKKIKIEYKGEIDPVTEADYLSQERIISIIKSQYPDHCIIAEEGNMQEETGSDCRWFVDPLDGTVNYSHSYPAFCVSVALQERGDLVVGAVYNPVLDEMFTASKGGGAYLNGSPIKVSTCGDIKFTLLCTGFPYDVKRSPENNLVHFADFTMAAQGVRRDGAAALDLCYVATGRFDGFWEPKLGPWDVAAGGLIVLEAGGRVTGFQGEEFDPCGNGIVASNGLIHDEMLSIIRKGMART